MFRRCVLPAAAVNLEAFLSVSGCFGFLPEATSAPEAAAGRFMATISAYAAKPGQMAHAMPSYNP